MFQIGTRSLHAINPRLAYLEITPSNMGVFDSFKSGLELRAYAYLICSIEVCVDYV